VVRRLGRTQLLLVTALAKQETVAAAGHRAGRVGDGGSSGSRREPSRPPADPVRVARGSAGGSKSSWTPLPSMSWSACVPCSKVI
jgi:hypothetical protein